MNEPGSETRARYGVEIRGVTVHAEVDKLAQVLSLVNGQSGRVHVIDRQTRTLVFHGTLDELREAVRLDSTLVTENSSHVAK